MTVVWHLLGTRQDATHMIRIALFSVIELKAQRATFLVSQNVSLIYDALLPYTGLCWRVHYERNLS